MMNLQDELAWLNHHLDRKLEEWWKLHQAYVKIIGLLCYSLPVAIVVYFYFPSNLTHEDGATWPPKFPSVLILVLASTLFAISFLKWKLYRRLLKDGHNQKIKLRADNLSSNYKETDLYESQKEFAKLMELERNFPCGANTDYCSTANPERKKRELEDKNKELVGKADHVKMIAKDLRQYCEHLKKEFSSLSVSLKRITGEIDSIQTKLKDLEEEAKSLQRRQADRLRSGYLSELVKSFCKFPKRCRHRITGKNRGENNDNATESQSNSTGNESE